MEGIYPTGLLILKEIEGEQFEFRPNLETAGDIWKPIPVEITDYELQPISKDGEIAWSNDQKAIWANYVSHILSFTFLTGFLITAFKKPMRSPST